MQVLRPSHNSPAQVHRLLCGSSACERWSEMIARSVTALGVARCV
jgi:hypothetical protein